MKRNVLLLLAVTMLASCSSDKDEEPLVEPLRFPQVVYGSEGVHGWVDLGLPSGLKWATMNVGAEKVSDYGKYYAWGETKAYGEEDLTNERNYSYMQEKTHTKTLYNEYTYKWAKVDSRESGYTKYSSLNVSLYPEDDAAVQNWGGRWRMPSHAEQDELVKYCYRVWTSDYAGTGVAGCIVYAAKSVLDRGKIEEQNIYVSSCSYTLDDAHIFLPAAGIRSRSEEWKTDDRWGYYWSSTSDVEEERNADCFLVNSNNLSYCGVFGRCVGMPVRAVCE